MDKQLHPNVYVDAITYTRPKVHSASAKLC